mmetsp:Transcript_3591/g.9529  ORF Transcript_3591/g.9529 Transcript_3591/m.9529 type:complete len:283 (-) Transcript_3591:1091-1939(-)
MVVLGIIHAIAAIVVTAALFHGAEVLRFLVPANGLLLRFRPLLDALVLAVQQQELPSLEEVWEQVKARRDAKQGHQWEDDGDRLQVLHQEHQSEEADLKDGVHVDAPLLHVLGVAVLGVLGWLLEEEEEAIPELDVGQAGETHEEEHSVQDWQREELEDVEDQERQPDHEVGEEHGEAGLLYLEEVAVTVLVGQGIQVDDAWNGGGHQPWQSQQAVDEVEESIETQIVVVRFSVLQVVALVVDEMPRDAVVEVAKHEGKDGRSGRHDGNPVLSVEVAKVNQP